MLPSLAYLFFRNFCRQIRRRSIVWQFILPWLVLPDPYLGERKILSLYIIMAVYPPPKKSYYNQNQSFNWSFNVNLQKCNQRKQAYKTELVHIEMQHGWIWMEKSYVVWYVLGWYTSFLFLGTYQNSSQSFPPLPQAKLPYMYEILITCFHWYEQCVQNFINLFLYQVAVDMDFNSEMLKLQQRVNPGESVMGW